MNANFPKLSRNAWLTACSAALLAAGCGGEDRQADRPRIQAAAATQLAAASDEIARLIDSGQVCEAAHRADGFRVAVQAEVDKGTVPAALAPQLVTQAQALVDEVNCEAPPQAETEGEDDEDGEDDDEGKGKGKKGEKERGKDD